MNVPFLDLKIQYQQFKAEIDAEIQKVCENTSFILGPQVTKFEEEFASFLGANYSVGLANGTESMTLIYEALGLGAGDEVIIPAHTFVATAIGAMRAALTPVLVDCDPKTYMMDLDKVEAAITSRTKAICPVHLYGRATDMDRVMEIAKKHALRVVEDTAQSHGAQWNGKTTGTFGDAGSFSFYPGKNLGAYGDGGAICTNSEEVYKKVRKLRNYGSEIKYEHPETGTNCRLDGIQAAVLSVKLKHLAKWNKQRWQAANAYCEIMEPLASQGLLLPEVTTPEQHVFHLFVVQVENREAFMKKMGEKGVSTGIHYPNPFHLQGGYSSLGYKAGAFPVCEEVSKKIVSLPMFPEITMEQIQFTCDAVKACL